MPVLLDFSWIFLSFSVLTRFKEKSHQDPRMRFPSAFAALRESLSACLPATRGPRGNCPLAGLEEALTDADER